MRFKNLSYAKGKKKETCVFVNKYVVMEDFLDGISGDNKDFVKTIRGDGILGGVSVVLHSSPCWFSTAILYQKPQGS